MRQVKLEQNYLRAMFYGDSGSGKTYTMGTAQACKETFPLLVLNASGQPISLRFFEPPPLVLEVESIKDFNDIYNWVAQEQPLPTPIKGLDWGSEEWYDKVARLPVPFNYIYEYLDKCGVRKFGSLGIDSITQVQMISEEEAHGMTHGEWNPTKVMPKNTFDEWDRVLKQMTGIAEHHWKLPIHMFITALARRDMVEFYGTEMYYPMLRGQSSLVVPSYADLVARMVPIESLASQKINLIKEEYGKDLKEDIVTVALTSGGRNYIAKWQGVKKNPGIVVNPTVEKFLSYLS